MGESNHKLVKVYETNSEVDLNMIIALLEDNHIPVHLEEKGMGEYLRIVQGVNIQGSSVMVRPEDFEEAKELIDQLWRDKNSGDALDEIELSKQALAAQSEEETAAIEEAKAKEKAREEAREEAYDDYAPLAKRRRLLINILKAMVIIYFGVIIILKLLAD